MEQFNARDQRLNTIKRKLYEQRVRLEKVIDSKDQQIIVYIQADVALATNLQTEAILSIREEIEGKG